MRTKFLTGLLFASLISTTVDVHAQANTSLSNLATPTAVNTHLLPGTNAARDFGSSSLNWRSIYFSDTIFLRGYKFISGDNNYNTSLGLEAGLSTSTSHTISIGYRALNNINSAGVNNIGIGSNTLSNVDWGSDNIAIGKDAGFGIVSSGWNIAIGNGALANGEGDGSVAVGYESLYNGGYTNTAVGNYSLRGNTWGHSNVGVGYESIYSNTVGEGNTALGIRSLWSTIGGYNVALGANSMIGTGSSGSTVAIGASAGHSLTSSSDNVFIGDNATATIASISNSIAIGSTAVVTASDQVRIGTPFTTSIGGYAGWTNLSDGRFKKNLKENVPGLSFITKLHPVTYTLDLDGLDKVLNVPLNEQARKAFKNGKEIPEREQSPEAAAARANKAKYVHTGFIAQEVEKAAKELGYNFSGVDAPKNGKDLYGLRYAEFVVPLVKAVQELNEQNAALEERVKKLEKLILKNSSGNQTVILSGAKLEQNVPNPFTGNTIIAYNIPAGETAGRLVITDMNGSVVKAINVNSGGKAQITLNKGTLAAGEYIYSLWVGETKVDSKRMSVK